MNEPAAGAGAGGEDGGQGFCAVDKGVEDGLGEARRPVTVRLASVCVLGVGGRIPVCVKQL